MAKLLDDGGHLTADAKGRLAIAAFFALGFVAWGSFCASVGLVFSSLEIEQYAVASFYTLIYGGMSFLTSWAAALLVAFFLRKAPETWDNPHHLFPGLKAIRIAGWTVVAAALATWGASRWEYVTLEKWWNLGFLALILYMSTIEALQHRLKTRQFVQFLWRFFFGLISCLAAPLAYVGMIAAAVHPPPEELLLVAVVMLLPAMVLVTRPPFTMRRLAPGPKLDHSEAKTAPPVTERPSKFTFVPTARTKRREYHRRLLDVEPQNLVLPLIMTMLMAGVSVGFAILPNFPTQLGGAKEHKAKFIMHPSDFDNATRRELFPEGAWASQSVEKTNNLTVVFRNSEWYFVRVPPNDTRQDRSFEIHRGSVIAVQWYG